MKYLKKYLNLFRPDKIEDLCYKFGISNFQIVDGLVNVDDSVYLGSRNLKKIPIKFGTVTGDFHCCTNPIISLEGSPHTVGGSFLCDGCKLTSLKGGPKSVGRHFKCEANNLTSLEGSPNSVGRLFMCDDNKLTSLNGSPNSVGGNFSCRKNKISDFKIPEFSLSEDSNFYCAGNPIYEIYKLFIYQHEFPNIPGRQIDHSECIDLINEYSVIQGDKVIWSRFEEVFYSLELEPPNPDNMDFKYFKIIL